MIDAATELRVDALLRAVTETWPPARAWRDGIWTIRDGQGGGGRVSAATLDAEAPSPDEMGAEIARAEAAMRALDRVPLFMLRPADAALDAALQARGYPRVDPVTLYAATPEALVGAQPSHLVMPAWPPLAIQREIWAEGGIGPARLAVMDRAPMPKTAILGRVGDHAAGCAFVAACGDIAMLHALETRARDRRRGLGRLMLQAAARWAVAAGCKTLGLVVTQANEAANALYRQAGMTAVCGYHYRSLDGTK